MDLEDVDSTRAWVATAVAGLTALVAASLLFPVQFYRGFVWRYFWGPVYADAHDATCAVNQGGTPELLFSSSACADAVAQGLIVSQPGYTPVSSVGYMVILLFMLTGVYQLVTGLGIGSDREFVYSLVPFMLFGGVLRVVQDSQGAVPEGVPSAIAYPWNTLLISPLIYFTVFAITISAVLVGAWAERAGYTAGYERPLMALGAIAFLATFGLLLWLWRTTEFVDFHPQVLLSTLTIATGLTAVIWVAIGKYAPWLNVGTQGIGAVVIWGHAIDGVANVIASDWLPALGVNLSYSPKHPANRLIIRATESVLPESVQAVTGTAWPFLVVKLVVPVAIIWVFNDEIFEESPRWAILLLIAIIAVGLGPGTRDMLRATFGI